VASKNTETFLKLGVGFLSDYSKINHHKIFCAVFPMAQYLKMF
jgi:hypothetical protein